MGPHTSTKQLSAAHALERGSKHTHELGNQEIAGAKQASMPVTLETAQSSQSSEANQRARYRGPSSTASTSTMGLQHSGFLASNMETQCSQNQGNASPNLTHHWCGNHQGHHPRPSLQLTISHQGLSAAQFTVALLLFVLSVVSAQSFSTYPADFASVTTAEATSNDINTDFGMFVNNLFHVHSPSQLHNVLLNSACVLFFFLCTQAPAYAI